MVVSLLDTSLLRNPFSYPQLRYMVSSGLTSSVSLFGSFLLLD